MTQVDQNNDSVHYSEESHARTHTYTHTHTHTGLLKELHIFELSNNELSFLPQSIGDIQRLKVLKLEDNKLKELPPELGIMLSLEDVRVRNNPLKIPPPEVIQKGTRHFLDYLRRIIDLQKNNICDLAGTGLEDPELPEYILRQKYVETLLLNDNCLRSLDMSVTRLMNLKLIDLDSNKLDRHTFSKVISMAIFCSKYTRALTFENVDSIPECVLYLTALETLRIGHNNLLSVHPDIAKLKNLKHLRLKGNPNLSFLPPAIGMLTSLETCDVSNCPMRGPPQEVVNEGAKVMVDYQSRLLKAETTGELYLDGFALLSSGHDKLDPNVLEFTNLGTLSLCQNRLNELEPQIGLRLTTLTELYLRSNFLRELPLEISHLEKLSVLHLDENELREISPWIGCLTNLVDLSIAQNQLEYLTEAIGNLPRLCKLNLTSNKLLTVPPEMARVTTMVSLNLDNNPLRSPPKEVTDKGYGMIMDYLRRLYVSMTSNSLQLVSMSLLQFPIEAQIYSSLTSIDCGDNLIMELGKSIGNHPSLQHLLIAHNRLEKVHPNIRHLVHLTRLHLPFNQLADLPETVSDLRELQILNLVENRLETIGEHICKVTSLTDLRVSHNKLKDMSRSVGLLQHLKRLNLECNQLTWLPDEFGGMSALTHLNINTNHFEALPETFWHLTHLEALDVSTNSLGMLPTGIGKCKGLVNFEFHENPFGSIPSEVINAGGPKLIEYLGCFFEAGPPPGCEKLPGAWQGKSKFLNLEGFHLVEVPPYVFGLGYLEVLSFKRNSISQLPPEVSLLRHMQRLDLESNLLRALPVELSLCPLVELKLGLNNLEEPPLEVRDRGCEVILRYLKAQYHAKKVGVLDIRHCFLTSLPPEVQRLAGPALHTMDMSDNLMPYLPNLRPLCHTKELRIGNNLLEHLPESIRLLSCLTSLHVHENQLTSLPVTFVHLNALLFLNLDANRLPNLPAVVCRVTSLTSLSVCNNRIPVLDAEVGQLKQLKELRVSGNGLQAIADELCDAAELRLIDLSNNNLELLPGHICTPGHMERLSNLRCLDITGNLLSVLPSGLGLLATSLEDLKYDDYELSQLPSEVLEEGEGALLQYLSLCHETLESKCLDLTSKGLQSVPRHIGEMGHLEELRLSGNHLVDLPEWIGQLKALRVLRIDQTGIRWLPFGLADCASLQMLDLDGLQLFAPPKQILSKGVPIIKEWLGRLREARGGHRLDLSSLGLEGWPVELNTNAKQGQYDSLQRLNLLDNILTELPVDVCELSSLTELTAGYNRLTEIHPKMGVLVNLKTLHLPFNQLVELPDSVGLIQSLRSVNLDGNLMKEMPPCLCVVTQLQELRLNQNKLSGLPGAMAKLVKLESLELCYNELGSVPRTIGFNTSLRRLKLSYNALVSIPPEIGMLNHLEELQLTHNQLSVLPAELGALLPPKGKLTGLGLTANYFKAPLSQIITRGTPATLRFLREQINVK